MAKRKAIANLSDLTPDTQNANKGTERGRYMVEASLTETGAGRSIVADKDGRIIAGNKTLEAWAGMGGAVKVIETDGNELVVVQRTDLDLSDPKGKARKLAYYDNRAGQVGLEWDAEQLLADVNAGVDLAAMFKADEIAELLAGAGGQGDADAEPQIDQAAELNKKWQVKPGDLWRIGAHRLLCGDSTKAADVTRVMGGERAALVVTSPPYNQKIDSFSPSGMHKEGKWVEKVAALAYADDLPEPEYQAQQRGMLALWASVLAPGGSVFYNHKNRYRGKRVVSPMEWILGPLVLRQEIVWSRPGSVTQNARMFLPSDERIYWLYGGDDFLFHDETDIKTWSTVWDINLETNKSHAVGFPVQLPLRCIRACSNSGDIVADPYAGSGTTLVACENLGRKCRAIEISADYCAVILERMAQAFPKLEITRDDGAG